MTFTATLPATGLVGWRFLAKTYDRQLETLSKSSTFQKDAEYFRAKIWSVKTAGDLVADRKLLKVALGAFGLDDDLNNKAFIRTILESPLNDKKSLANRLSDPRYKEMAAFFGMANKDATNTWKTGFAEKILTKYQVRNFELEVGKQSDAMRLALTAQRELNEIASEPGSDNTKWFKALGRPPLRSFLETALGLPKDFGKIDIDQQLGEIKSLTKRAFGIETFADFRDPMLLNKVIDRYHIMEQSKQGAFLSSANIALQLLQR